MIPYVRRLGFAFRTFFSILDHRRIPADVLAELAPASPAVAASVPSVAPPPQASRAPDSLDRATQMLALLQRDGRLVDFLMEDLGGYADAQVGAAVRDVHAGCRQALEKYVTLAPVLDAPEGEPATIDRTVDPARVKVVGNVTGQPPFRGIVRHRGWEATGVELPPLGATGRMIVAPAEVEVP